MKKKIFSIIAVLTFMASFALPALVPQNAWADTTIEQYCYGNGWTYSNGGCVARGNFSSNWCSDQGGNYTPPSSSSKGEASCFIKVTSSATTADTPSSESPTNDPDTGGGGTSKTAGSSGASSAQESSPGQMKKTGDCKEGEVYTSIIGGGGCVSIEENGGNIFNILNIILTVLTYGVGIAGTLGIIISGIQYLTARDNEQQMVKAKSRLINIVIGLAAYAFMWAFLQWLIPGGLLSGGN